MGKFGPQTPTPTHSHTLPPTQCAPTSYCPPSAIGTQQISSWKAAENEPHAQLISRLESLLCNFLSTTHTHTSRVSCQEIRQINCVFPFYFDWATFSQTGGGGRGGDGNKLATFAAAICRFMRFSCGTREKSGKACFIRRLRDHLCRNSRTAALLAPASLYGCVRVCVCLATSVSGRCESRFRRLDLLRLQFLLR